jgi:hypothetical protein
LYFLAPWRKQLLTQRHKEHQEKQITENRQADHRAGDLRDRPVALNTFVFFVSLCEHCFSLV